MDKFKLALFFAVGLLVIGIVGLDRPQAAPRWKMTARIMCDAERVPDTDTWRCKAGTVELMP